MQAAKLFYYLITRTNMQMVSIRKLHQCTYLFKILRGYRPFYGCCRTYIHKYGRLYSPVYGNKLASLGSSVLSFYLKHYDPAFLNVFLIYNKKLCC